MPRIPHLHFDNTSQLVRYCLDRYQVSRLQEGPLSDYPEELPAVEQLGTVAGVTLARICAPGTAWWLEATCDFERVE